MGDGSSVKPIEIPPPRPKRKPVHPYPRKLVSPLKTGILIPEKQERSASPNTLMQENLSPTSVLSAVGSDQSDSCIPNGSPSPVSSAPKIPSEDAISSSQSDREDEDSSTDEEILPLVLDRFILADLPALLILVKCFFLLANSVYIFIR